MSADVCTTNDYAPLVRQIARTGARTQRPVLRLGHDSLGVTRVEVDGVEVPYEAVDQAIVLDPAIVAGAREIRVGYLALRD